MSLRQELSLHMPLVQQVVARVQRRLPPNVLRDDLLAAGAIGLLDALRRSPQRGPQFEAYARIRIRGAVIDELRAQDWLPRRARTRAARADEGVGPAADRSTIVGLYDLPEVQASSIVDESRANPEEEVEQHSERAALERAVAQLPEREASIVTWHYFEGVAFKEIATRLGVSEPRISQLHARAMGRLRTNLEPDQRPFAV